MRGFVNIFLLVSIHLGAVSASAQLIFTFVPEVYARSIDGLGTFKVQNLSGSRYEGQVSIIVANGNGSPIVNILTPTCTFNPGVNIFPRGLFTNSAFKFFSSSTSSLVSQTKTFPPGEYSFCYRFMPSNKQTTEEYENCFDASIQPLLPITLLLPAEHDTICIKRPVLSWQPPMPFNAAMRFRVLLTEKKDGAGSTASVIKNSPLLLLDNISATSLNYPSSYPELKEGKTYYWQVAAFQQSLVISTSEVWEFTVQCNEPQRPVPIDSYRELKLLQNGNYYIANQYLKFSFLNNYNVSNLEYSIYDLGNGEQAIKHLPRVGIQPGLNKIDIDLTELGLAVGKYYLLKVTPFNETPVRVKFIYKEE